MVEEAVEMISAETSPYKERFKDAMWFEYLQKRWVMILGQGSIGSWTSLLLGRIGCNIYTFDMDNYEQLNLAGQLVGKNDVGKKKVDVAKEMWENFCDTSGSFITEASKYTKDSPSNHIVIAAFDNMEARKVSFENWVNFVEGLSEEDKKKCIFIDGRLSVEDYFVFAVRPGQEDRYRKFLFDDSEVEELPCSLKSTSHCAAGIASDIVSVLTNFATNTAVEMDLRVIPFMIRKSTLSYTYESEE